MASLVAYNQPTICQEPDCGSKFLSSIVYNGAGTLVGYFCHEHGEQRWRVLTRLEKGLKPEGW